MLSNKVFIWGEESGRASPAWGGGEWLPLHYLTARWLKVRQSENTARLNE